MWRAYGGAVGGVAIVFNVDVFETDGDQLNVFAHPVTYGVDAFAGHFYDMLTTLLDNQKLLALVPRERAKSVLFHAILDLMLTTKHVGFEEEKEWRIIHSPTLFPSAYVPAGMHSIGGMPQIIHKIGLYDQPNLNMPELELDRLIHSIIIGPCQHPEQVAFTLGCALGEAGVTAARERIRVSDIPLRQRTS